MAVCRSCGKGLCPRCSADTGVGVGCRDSCEERVLILGQMVTHNARVMRTADAQTRSSGLFAVLMGALSIGLGWWAYEAGNQFVAAFTGGSGIILAVFGLVRLCAERYPKLDKRGRGEQPGRDAFGDQR